jgi:hypothetical protein
VRVTIDAAFGEETERFDFRFTCRDCFYFSGVRTSAGPDVPSGRHPPLCAHEWPNELHLERPPAGASEVVFCKEFELR